MEFDDAAGETVEGLGKERAPPGGLGCRYRLLEAAVKPDKPPVDCVPVKPGCAPVSPARTSGWFPVSPLRAVDWGPVSLAKLDCVPVIPGIMQDCVPDRPARTPDCDPVSLGTPFGPIAARLLFPSLDNASEDDAFPSSEIDFGRASVDPGVVPVLLVVSPPESAGNPAQGRRDVKADRRWCTAEAAVKLRPHADEERAGGEDGRSAVCPLEVITSAAVSPAENGRPEGPCRPKVAATMGYIHFVNKRNMQAQLFF